MDLDKFARLVRRMLEAQEKFKDRRMYSDLLPARKLEKEVHAEIKKIVAKADSEIADIFSE